VTKGIAHSSPVFRAKRTEHQRDVAPLCVTLHKISPCVIQTIGGIRMPKPHLYLSEDAIARAKFELLEFTRGDPVSCACLRADGKAYILIRTNQQLYLMDSQGEFYTAVCDDVGLVALDVELPQPGSGHHLHHERA
jgi:hypothetical protein